MQKAVGFFKPHSSMRYHIRTSGRRSDMRKPTYLRVRRVLELTKAILVIEKNLPTVKQTKVGTKTHSNKLTRKA